VGKNQNGKKDISSTRKYLKEGKDESHENKRQHPGKERGVINQWWTITRLGSWDWGEGKDSEQNEPQRGNEESPKKGHIPKGPFAIINPAPRWDT